MKGNLINFCVQCSAEDEITAETIFNRMAVIQFSLGGISVFAVLGMKMRYKMMCSVQRWKKHRKHHCKTEHHIDRALSHEFTNSFATRYSAIWTAFVAAPFRRLSATIHILSVFGWLSSRRIRPTKTSSFPWAYKGIG